jgi:hypothetical protein
VEVPVITAWAMTVTCVLLSGCASTGSESPGAGPPTSSIASASAAVGLLDRIGGKTSLTTIASRFVHSSLNDPRLSGLTAGKAIDESAMVGKVSDQLCALLGGGCQAPLTDAQLSTAAGKVSADQSKAIWDNFQSALNGVVSDMSDRQLLSKAVVRKLPGMLAGLL